ncbi:pyridoxal phosphate-dependent aminotransferase [Halolamina salifodinae]|uniref:Aminotransferase n=1 Tax=Halolamina salifodinae TaxID=1202767 RepID=A0A8T4GU91_9EURY|nr:pyridoxal phosphate-dependent aminotransferase [Halolamina salifodinae]MBP1985702.1 aspartate aminotransferase [Halolamina salifodinae]
MPQFSDRVERIAISGIREVFEAAGEDAINLGLGQPDFPTPEHARQGAIDAIEAGKTDAYTGNKGVPELREGIVQKHERDLGLEYHPEQIIATAGGSEALHIALEAHVGPGDEVIIPDPGFVAYDALTKLTGAEPVPVPVRDDLTIDPGAIEAAITEDTAAFVVNSPGNPTGAVSPVEDVEAFGRIAEEHDLLCISDEVYGRILFEGEHRSPAEFAPEQTVIVDSASKTYSMTGWRLGWVAGAPERVERMLRAHQYVQACASAPAQYAAASALNGPQDVVGEMAETFQARRDLVVDGLREIGLDVPEPEGAFYVMPEVPEGFVDECIARGVVVVPGEAFGDAGEGYARISYATSTEELEEALAIMAEAYESVI